MRPRPEVSRHHLVDDDDERRPFAVLTIELPPGDNLNAHSFKITGPHRVAVYPWVIAARRFMAFDDHLVTVAAEHKRYVLSQTRPLHARRPFDLINYLLVKQAATRFVISGRFHVERNSKYTLRLKSRIEALRLPQAAYEHPRADQQEQRDRDLRDDQQTTQAEPRSYSASGSTIILQHRDEVEFGGEQRRGQPEQHA